MSEQLDPAHILHRNVMNDETRHVARVYADALYKAAEAEGTVDTILEELESLTDGVFKRNPGLELFFVSASIGRTHKNEVIEKTFGGQASGTFVRFLEVVNDHDRLDMLHAIAKSFRAMYNRKARRLVVHVRSAVPLTDDEKARLSEDVRAVAHVEPILDEKIDPDILGGMIIRIQDWVFDSSVRTRLLGIRNQLIERSSHVIQSGRDRFYT